jgi:hypothetical protein
MHNIVQVPALTQRDFVSQANYTHAFHIQKTIFNNARADIATPLIHRKHSKPNLMNGDMTAGVA